MNTAVLKGSVTLGAGDFSRKALLAVTVLLCAHLLPPARFGDYIFLLSFYQIIAVLAGAGLPSSVLRRVARLEESGMRSGLASLLARLVYVLPAAALMYPVIWLMGLSAQYFPALALLAAMMVVRGAAENISFIFQGREDQLNCAKVGVSQAAVTLLLTLGVCLTSKSLLGLIGAHVIGGFVSAVYGFVLLHRTRRDEPFPGGVLAEARSLLADSHWLNAGAFVASAYNRVDVLLLRRILAPEAVAVYAAPYRILDLTQIIPSSLMATILPGWCRPGRGSTQSLQPRTAMRFLVVIALALVVIVTVVAPWLTLLLFGRAYGGSIPVLEVLIWVCLPMFWNFALNSQLIATSFDRAILHAASIGLAVNLGLNLLLIPKFGYMACAVVTLITEFALLAANVYFVSRVGASPWPEKLGRLAWAAVLVAGFCFCWTRAGAGYWAAALLLILAAFVLPLSWSDFSGFGMARSSTLASPANSVVPENGR